MREGDHVAPSSSGPRCPDCGVRGLDQVTEASLSDPKGSGREPGFIVHCRACGHVYGLMHRAPQPQAPQTAAPERQAGSAAKATAAGSDTAANAGSPTSSQPSGGTPFSGTMGGTEFTLTCPQCGESLTISARIAQSRSDIQCVHCGSPVPIDSDDRAAASRAMEEIQRLRGEPQLTMAEPPEAPHQGNG